jgi:hypothetical protein
MCYLGVGLLLGSKFRLVYFMSGVGIRRIVSSVWFWASFSLLWFPDLLTAVFQVLGAAGFWLLCLCTWMREQGCFFCSLWF